MLDTLPTASRSRVSGLVAGARPARTSGWACASSTGNDSRSGSVPFSRGHQLRRLRSSRAYSLRVVFAGRSRCRRHRLPHRVVGRVHEPRDLDVRDVERLAALVEVIRLAVLGQPVGDLRPRDAEQVAQGVLIFVAIEPALDRPAFAGQGRPLRGDDRPRQALDEGLLPGRRRAGPRPWAASRPPSRGRAP